MLGCLLPKRCPPYPDLTASIQAIAEASIVSSMVTAMAMLEQSIANHVAAFQCPIARA